MPCGLPSIFIGKRSIFPRELLATVVEPSDSFLVPPNEKKVYQRQVALDAGPNSQQATIFTFNREDHTLAHLLTEQLRKNPSIDFVAYKTPHPLVHSFELRVHMCKERKKGYEARDAVLEACQEMHEDLKGLGQKLTQEWFFYKAAKEGGLEGGDNVAALSGGPVYEDWNTGSGNTRTRDDYGGVMAENNHSSGKSGDGRGSSHISGTSPGHNGEEYRHDGDDGNHSLVRNYENGTVHHDNPMSEVLDSGEGPFLDGVSYDSSFKYTNETLPGKSTRGDGMDFDSPD